MLKYVGKRVLMAALTLVCIVLIMFMLMEMMPGTPFNDEKLTEDQIAVLYTKYGLDQPVPVRFGKYLTNTLKGDFGVSYVLAKNLPISELLKNRFPVTVRIAVQSMLLGTFMGILLGVLAAIYHGSFWDPLVSFISMLGASIPSYVFALGMMYFIAYKLGWLPVLYNAKTETASTILPSIALSMSSMSNIARFTRTQMIEVLNSDYITLAESKGISKQIIILRHAMRNSLIPLLTVIAPMIVGLMFGSTIIESIFAIPGIGSLFIQSIQVNDYNVVISLAFIYSAVYILTMLAVDILYGVIDPRVRVASKG